MHAVLASGTARDGRTVLAFDALAVDSRDPAAVSGRVGTTCSQMGGGCLHSEWRLRWRGAFRRCAFPWRPVPGCALLRAPEQSAPLAASRFAQRAIDGALRPGSTFAQTADVAIVGAGLAGLIIASTFVSAHVGVKLVVLEKSATAGGTWRHYGNAFSRVNSSEPSYRLGIAREHLNPNHSYHHEILSDILGAIQQRALAPRIHLHTPWWNA